ncbi:leucine rich repeat [Clonorchis sinensis]|uniref:Leucine rich repeat n=2 Tax=Clonorchis sinensis TaxID=79923 RepID=A0A8T1MIR7_CLOSI|nr:leucine rich repeat [Clonorchis sinensis]GAA29002.2 leucine-rich repeat and coiled-coil domain-containing protein 1 [Clonorchis sinensis]
MAEPAEIYKIDSGVGALPSVKLDKSTTILNLHHNGIVKIEALDRAVQLQHLDLSSNLISRMEGLNGLTNLHTLNLSSNVIRKVEGIELLRSLVNLNLSFNVIDDLAGLRGLHGRNYSLTVLQLQGNRLNCVEHLLQYISGLENLRQLTLADPQACFNNPLCSVGDYRQTVLDALPQLAILDNLDRSGRPVQVDLSVTYPELKYFLDFVDAPSTVEALEFERPTQDQNISRPDQQEKGDIHRSKNVSQAPCDKATSIHSNQNNTNAEGTSDKHFHCTLSSVTERRLANLEDKLSSLMALQLNCFGQPGAVHREYPFEAPKNTRNALTTICGRNPPILNSAGEGFVDGGQPVCEHETKATTVSSARATMLHPDETLEVPSTRRPTTAIRSKSPSPVTFSLATSRDAAHAIAEEHPPGAPKRPNTVRSTARSNGHPVHGKPISSRRANSTPSGNYGTTMPVREPLFSRSPVGKNLSMQRRYEPRELTEDNLGRTLGQLLQELHTERNQRRTAENVCRELMDRVRRLEASAADEAKVREATEKLKQAFSAEHRARLDAETRIRELDGRLLEVSSTLDVMQTREEAEKSRMVEETNKMSTRLMELARDYEKAVTRAEQAEKKVNEMQSLLQKRDSENKELSEKRLALDSPELNQLLAAHTETVELRHQQALKALNEKLEASEARYHSLEEEFRVALRIEADRYGDLFKAMGILKQQLVDVEQRNKDLEQRERTAQQLVSELTTAIKEQKSRTVSQQKSNLIVQSNQKERIATLETQLQEAQNRFSVLENLRKENKHLKAELAAQESLVMGLRAERRNWSEELAQQGSTLAQDRGRLEAKVEAQADEIISLKKNLEQQLDNVKIKSKIIDDQTETIRDLKKATTENQRELKRIQDDAVAVRQRLEEQLLQKKKEADEHEAKLERLVARKEELKETVIGLESKNEELQAQNESLNQRWCDRTSLLDKLEKQVELMRQTWEREQQTLISERDIAKERINELQTQIEQMNIDYQRQFEMINEAKNMAISTTQREAELLRSNCESRVAEVESEMRAVLIETEHARNVMEARLRKLSMALLDSTTLSAPPLSHCYKSQSNQWFTHQGLDSAPSLRPTSESSNVLETVNPSSTSSGFINSNP